MFLQVFHQVPYKYALLIQVPQIKFMSLQQIVPKLEPRFQLLVSLKVPIPIPDLAVL